MNHLIYKRLWREKWQLVIYPPIGGFGGTFNKENTMMVGIQLYWRLGDAGDNTTHRQTIPLALVIIGGLISSTILSRIVTPVVYKLIPPAVHEEG